MAQLLQLGLDLLDIPLPAADQALGLAREAGQGELVGLEALGRRQIQQLGAAVNQFGPLLLKPGSSRDGLGLQDLTAAELTDLPALSACDAQAGRPS
ncbi:MAG: hypothetical protein J7M29_01025 [Verrucomicrobia bacterium]|nr:hypothetical protein [Verrucomicrobiota bacterium]